MRIWNSLGGREKACFLSRRVRHGLVASLMCRTPLQKQITQKFWVLLAIFNLESIMLTSTTFQAGY